MPALTTRESQILTININADRIIAALLDNAGKLSAVNALPTPVTEGREEILRTIKAVAKQVLLDTSNGEIRGIGIALSASVDRKQGLILKSETLPQLDGVLLADILQAEFSYPVIVENDVNAMALLEAHSGAGQGVDSIFYIFVDDDIKGAIVQDGKIWRGTHSSAGEIAYLVVDWMGTKAITLGQRASGQGIAAEYNMRSRKHRIPTIDEIIQYARQGDHLAIRVIRDGARISGSVLRPVMNLIDPSLVVVSGRFAHTGDLWWSNFVLTFNDAGVPHIENAPAVRAQYDEDAALRGIALLSQRMTAN